MITHHGIKVNPNQIKAIHDLHPPRNPKEIQCLTGMMAALNRFISKFVKRCRPFFQLLHKWKDFTWSEECDKAFTELKAYLAHPPILSKLENEEVLYVYVAVAQHAMSLVLIHVDEGVQKPMYYINKSLQEAEVRYLYLEKAILAIIHATKKLPHYFQAHTVGAMLGAFNVKYMPRTTVKGQVLVDLVAEFTRN